MPRCKSCEALIVFAKTEKGHRIPLDAEVVDGTLVAVEAPNANLVGVGEAGSGRNPVLVRYVQAGAGRFLTHFATCPNAPEHRRR